MMSFPNLRSRQASVVWLEPHRAHAGDQFRPVPEPQSAGALDPILAALPPGPTHWVVDDHWIPSLLLRDIVEVPAGTEAKEAFFRWRFSQSLNLEDPQFVQSVSVGENAWLLAGIPQELRETWLQASMASGRPMRSLMPRWLWIHNHIAPTREVPGMLLSLCPAADGGYTGTLTAWGRQLTLLRQWAEPATPEIWLQERMLPTIAYLQRDARGPHEILVWGATRWPDGPAPTRILPPEIPAQEAY
jgi:hypothetical protein